MIIGTCIGKVGKYLSYKKSRIIVITEQGYHVRTLRLFPCRKAKTSNCSLGPPQQSRSNHFHNPDNKIKRHCFCFFCFPLMLPH